MNELEADGSPNGTLMLGDTGSQVIPVKVDSQGNLKSTTASVVVNGKKLVTTAGTRVALATTQAVSSVTIKALAANTGTIYVGDSAVASTNGFQLAAGDTVSLDITDLSTVSLDCSVNGDGVTYVAVA